MCSAVGVTVQTRVKEQLLSALCSLCGVKEVDVKQIFRGPVNICRECWDSCGKALSGASLPDWRETSSDHHKCSLCGRDPSFGVRILFNQAADSVGICDDCVAFVGEVKQWNPVDL